MSSLLQDFTVFWNAIISVILRIISDIFTNSVIGEIFIFTLVISIFLFILKSIINSHE